MAPLDTAVRDLRQVLVADPASPEWRRLVRHRLTAVREALAAPDSRSFDGWLTARVGSSNRERRLLQARVAALAAVLLDRLDLESLDHQLQRLTGDLEHYLQRVHDLVYDSVSLELGGSE